MLRGFSLFLSSIHTSEDTLGEYRIRGNNITHVNVRRKRMECVCVCVRVRVCVCVCEKEERESNTPYWIGLQ